MRLGFSVIGSLFSLARLLKALKAPKVLTMQDLEARTHQTSLG